MPQPEIRSKNTITTRCATWFGCLALVPAAAFLIPLLLGSSDRLREREAIYGEPQESLIIYILINIVLYGCIPIATAAIFGARYGRVLLEESESMPESRAFFIGLKIALAAGLTWCLCGSLWLILVGHNSRGGVMPVAFFGFPLYGLIAALGARHLRNLGKSSGITNDERGQKTTE